VAVAAQGHEHGKAAAAQSHLEIPSALRAEHAEIHARLEAATKLAGATGEAARALAAVLHPHFVREEQIALPPLGLLERLGHGAYEDEMAAVLPLTDSLQAELPRMLEEHKAIAEATRRLRSTAAAENNAEVTELAEELLLHARNEEEVTYPAALLVGEVVRSRAHAAKPHE
jgi:iron-sulfur cluster repair protein YtfE (RIC family)